MPDHSRPVMAGLYLDVFVLWFKNLIIIAIRCGIVVSPFLSLRCEKVVCCYAYSQIAHLRSMSIYLYSLATRTITFHYQNARMLNTLKQRLDSIVRRLFGRANKRTYGTTLSYTVASACHIDKKSMNSVIMLSKRMFLCSHSILIIVEFKFGKPEFVKLIHLYEINLWQNLFFI